MLYMEWSKALNQGSEICAVFFDLRKAFDSVPHRSLIDKLRALDLDPYILRCMLLLDGKELLS